VQTRRPEEDDEEKEKQQQEEEETNKEDQKSTRQSKGGDMERKMITMAHKQRTRMARRGKGRGTSLAAIIVDWGGQ